MINDDMPTPPHALFTPARLLRLLRVLAAGAALWLLPMAGLALCWPPA